MFKKILCLAVLFTFIVASPVAASGKGQFKGQCQPSGSSEFDPIVKPTPGMGHLHNFWGNTGVPYDESVDTVEEMQQQGTTCEDGSEGGLEEVTRDNKGAYWMPQPYINDAALIPDGSGFYYSSKGGLNPAATKVTPFGLKLIARHGSMLEDKRLSGEFDISCPAGVLSQDLKLPDGKNTVPPAGACVAGSNIDIAITFPECLDTGTLGMSEQKAYRAIGRGTSNSYCANGLVQIPTLQMFLTYRIPETAGTYAGAESLTVAGMGGKLPWTSIHADYFNSEDLTREVKFCINATNSENSECK